MVPQTSRERRNACYGDQFQPILTRGLNSSQRDIRAASAYFQSDAVEQECTTNAPQNSEASSVNQEQFESLQQQPDEGLPRSNSGSSSSWEDDIVPDTQHLEGDEPESGTEASNKTEQSSIPDFSDGPIDSVLGLWERRTKSPTENRISFAIEAFPPLGPDPVDPGLYEGNPHDSNLPFLVTVPSSSFSSSAPKTPQRPSSPSDTLHLSDYSPSSPASQSSFPNSSTLSRHRALSHQPTYGCPQFSSQSFEDQHNPSPDVYKIRLDTPPQPRSFERKPFLDFSSPYQSFGSENQPPESQCKPLCNPQDPYKQRKSNPKSGRGNNPLPSPHDFETLNRRNRFDPLSYIPGNESRCNNLRESPLPSPPAFSPPFEKFPNTPTYPGECSNTQTSDTADSNDLIQKYSIPYSELPLQSAPVKRKPRRSLRLAAASLKRILAPKHKTLSNDDPTAVSSPPAQQIQENESPTDAELAWFEGVIQQLQNECGGEQERDRDAMDPGHLDPSSAMVALTKQKAEAVRLAREQGAAVKEMCRRAKTDMPPYQFEELIGKGAYGRVYKGRQLATQKPVAIKVLEIDTLDYKTVRDFRDESIKDFIRETNIMKQVKDAGAKNINMLIEAFSIHSQLWLICEHCPGGSVKTLMRATGDKLQERFIIPIARELAEGLRAIHDAGIIHRDVKAANVLIHEEGRLQICDFGVAGVLQSKVDKRSTWIGTPHWMPPEMFPNRGGGEQHQYGSEIDVWAYGCTLFECATGNPPNATLRERMQIGRQLNRFPPKLEGDNFSDGLRSLVAFSLDSDPKVRPNMQNILQHPYVANSLESHPTASLSELVKIYYQWVQRGGQRISLFNPGGAAAAEFPDAQEPLDGEDWNFSTTAGFERRFSLIDLDQLSASLADLENDMIPTVPQPSGDYFDDNNDTDLSAEDKANFDERVKRGAAAMEGLFNEEKPGYKYETKNDFVPVQQEQRLSSDLPLRTDTDRSSVTSTFIDINLGVFDSAHYAAGSASNHPPFQLADADTIRANRSSSRLMRNSTTSSDSGEYQPQRGPRPPTMEWTFPSAMPTDTEDASHDDEPGPEFEQTQQEKRDTRAWTFPVMTVEAEEPSREEPDDWADGNATSRRVEPDDEMTKKYPPLQRPYPRPPPVDVPLDSRPSTATSIHSTISDADNDPFRFDRPPTPPREDVRDHTTSSTTSSLDRFPSITDSVIYTDFDEGTDRSIHSYSEFRPQTSYQEENMMSGSDAFGGGLGNNQNGRTEGTDGDSEADGEVETKSAAESDMAQLDFPHPAPPSVESMMEGASDEVVAQELDRLLGDFLHGLAVTGETLVRTDVGRGRWSSVGDSGDDSFRGSRLEHEQESEQDD
ncbi:STE/STE20/YSK protein kinase [Emergomyces pasteurianus Ep9510]|uniref:non-specific serine/threonine protein kinase n=1 Tax=Emergomyces pasteurianus Ep9510 TaxID=1447872 RepID=A0A1J9P8W9_9EURO|nr:STE/STE20/YSK protein kinase [Emergomyces pasteurianus Ep9510]